MVASFFLKKKGILARLKYCVCQIWPKFFHVKGRPTHTHFPAVGLESVCQRRRAVATLRPPSAATARADAKRQVKDPADKHTKAEATLTCPARCAIAALLPSPNGNESACLPAFLPAASPAHHFVSHLPSPPPAPRTPQHQIPLLNPPVAVSIRSR